MCVYIYIDIYIYIYIYFFFPRDGIHLSAEGSKMVVEEILKVIKEADWEPCLHWKSVPTEFAEDSPTILLPLM